MICSNIVQRDLQASNDEVRSEASMVLLVFVFLLPFFLPLRVLRIRQAALLP
jgi:hypothetical protein